MTVKRVFVASPLSARLKDSLSKVYGENYEQISLGSLKNKGVISTLRLLRSITAMQVVLEDTESEKLIDLFLLLFFFTKSKEIYFTHKDLSTYSLRKRDAMWSFLKTGWAVVRGFYYAFKSLVLSKTSWQQRRVIDRAEAKNILYLKTNFWFGIKAGGSVAHIEGVISGFKSHGFNIDYAGVDCAPALTEHVNNVIKLPIPNCLSIIYSTNLYIFDHLIYKHMMRQDYKDYDFIYHRMALNSLAAILVSKKTGLPLILEYNGSEVWVQRNWGKPLFLESISQSVEDACLRCADYIVTISDVLKQELIGRGIPAAKIISYPNCVDPKKYNLRLYTAEELVNTRAELGFQQDDIVMTFVGTFGQWHGVDILAKIIRSMYELDTQWLQKKRVKFLLVGDGMYMPVVKQILSAIPNYASFVNLVGLIPQNEAPKYLALSDILLSPHAPANQGEKFFGSPTKLFEYMAMQKVIIASDLDQIAEVLAPAVHIDAINNMQDDAQAILCEPGNVDQFRIAIKYAVDHLSELAFMAENAQRKVLREYTWDKHVEIILNALSERAPEELKEVAPLV